MNKKELITEFENRYSEALGEERRGGLGYALTALEHGDYSEAKRILVDTYCFDEATLLDDYLDDFSGFTPGWNN